MERTITAEQTARFAQALQAADRAPGTIENYLRHIRAFARWLGDHPLLPESAAQWRDALLEQGYTPGTVNSMIGPLNRFFQFLGWNECKAKQLRIQRQLFRENQKELTRGGVPPAALHSPNQRPGAPGSFNGSHLRHGNTGQRGAAPDGGGCQSRKSRDLLKRKDPHHPHPGEAAEKAFKLYKTKKYRLRAGVPDQERLSNLQKADLGGDEVSLQKSRGGGQQGLSPQPAAPVSPGCFTRRRET